MYVLVSSISSLGIFYFVATLLPPISKYKQIHDF